MNDQAPIEVPPEANNQKPAKATPPPLAPCPCGKAPTNLLIEMPERAKYGRCMGDCCAEWSVEFRNGYSQDPEQTTERAREAWNAAPRAGNQVESNEP